jgi:hypothetical protein
MVPKFVASQSFERHYKRLKKRYASLPADLERFKIEYATHPESGVNLGGGFRKVRLMVRSKRSGKRGGLRVITYDMYLKTEGGTIILVAIYDKSERESIRESEYQSILERFLHNG